MIAGHWSFLPVPFSSLISCHHSRQHSKKNSGRNAVPCLEDNLSDHYSFSDRMLIMSLNFFSLFNKVLLFIRFFILHAVLKSCLWSSGISLLGHLTLLQVAAHVEDTFKAQDFRHDNRALIMLAICFGFVSSFVRLLSGFQYLFNVFQKSFVYLLPLCVILQGNFLLFVHSCSNSHHRSGIWYKTHL